jgi:neutral trehalase
MDNSPRFDAGHHVAAVDFASMLCLEFQILSEMARILGLSQDGLQWDARSQKLAQEIDRTFWNEEAGFYFDVDLSTGTRSKVAACTGFYPLICGAASATQAARLAAALNDPKRFGPPLRVPTVSREDPAFGTDMWRGPAWINVNWLVAFGLDRCGHSEDARVIRRESVAEIERRYFSHGSLFEFYDSNLATDPPDLLRKGECAPLKSPYRQVFHDFGWTATLYIDMVHSLHQ